MAGASPTERTLNELSRIRDAFLRDLEAKEAGAIKALVEQYAGIVKRLRAQIQEDWEKIEARKATGETPRRSWIYETGRLQRLLDQAEFEFRGWSTLAAQVTAALQGEAVAVAGAIVGEQLRLLFTPAGASSVVVGFDVLPVDVLEHLVGTLRDGSPLVRLFDEIGPQVRERMAEALTTGIVKGDSPRVVGRRIQKAASIGLARGVRIARTEMMRSYRTAHHDNYRANSDVLAGWIWLSSRNGRTCAACLAMHGTFHKLDEELLDHPNGRCTPMPVSKSFAQMGLADVAAERGWQDMAVDPAEVETGEAWFKKQPLAVKAEVLGAAGASAYVAGRVSLADFVTVRKSRTWGNSINAASLATALENARRRTG
jgi:SPP1 gp7 family putative phage head morphogenesis protein